MPRQNRRRASGAARAPGGGAQRSDEWRGEEYTVRAVTGQASGKSYRCPGCDQELRPGMPHLVVWAAADIGAEDRRHWHRVCWDARDTRRPGVMRSRNAPRY